jgi:hypothetical protein
MEPHATGFSRYPPTTGLHLQHPLGSAHGSLDNANGESQATSTGNWWWDSEPRFDSEALNAYLETPAMPNQPALQPRNPTLRRRLRPSRVLDYNWEPNPFNEANQNAGRTSGNPHQEVNYQEFQLMFGTNETLYYEVRKLKTE